jgi:hypothetical protein
MADTKNKKQESALIGAAEAVGSAIGKIAHAAGVTADKPATPPKRAKVAKLASKNKPHLPRKLKKAQKKVSQAASS